MVVTCPSSARWVAAAVLVAVPVLVVATNICCDKFQTTAPLRSGFCFLAHSGWGKELKPNSSSTIITRRSFSLLAFGDVMTWPDMK
jgi:hypothetical protein